MGEALKTQSPLILCYGELLYDFMSNTPAASLSDPSAWTTYPGGSPANVAACLASLGCPVALASAVGDDQAGHSLKRHFHKMGVDVSRVSHIAKTRTRRIFVRRTLDGEREFVGFDGDNSRFADTKYIRMPSFDGDFVVSGTIGAAFEGSEESLNELMQMTGVKVVLDVNWREQIWAGLWTEGEAREKILQLTSSDGVFLVKASIEDVEFLLGEKCASEALANPNIVRKELGMMDHGGVIVTAGGKGASCVFGGGHANNVVTASTGAFVPSGGVVDTTGAGDGFLAAFLAELAKTGCGDDVLRHENELQRIMEFSAKVAGIVVGGHGAIDSLKSRRQVDLMTGTFTTR